MWYLMSRKNELLRRKKMSSLIFSSKNHKLNELVQYKNDDNTSVSYFYCQYVKNFAWKTSIEVDFYISIQMSLNSKSGNGRVLSIQQKYKTPRDD